MRFLISRVVVPAMMVSLARPSMTIGQDLVDWGVKVGLTSANQTRIIGGITADCQSRVGLSAGVFAEWIDHPWLSVNSEVYYNQKGHKLDIPITTAQFPDGTGEFTRESVKLDYLCVSVLPKLRVSLGPVELYALVGPRMDIAIGQSVTVEGPEPLRSNYMAGWNSHLSHYRDIQVGGDVAVGCVSYALLPMRLGAEVRYSPDFTTSFDIPGFTETNRSWEFLLTVSI